MSYTNTELVKSLLVQAMPLLDRLFDQPLILSGSDPLTFFSGSVDEDTVRVKSLQTNQLTHSRVTLQAGKNSLNSQPLVSGSIVVASDSSLGQIYAENDDYIIDYSEADLIIKGSGLSVGQTVSVWLVAFELYNSGSDYSLNANSGQLTRVSGGNIADGETIYLDYTPGSNLYTDASIKQAVIMANGMIERKVDPNKSFGADPTLESAATFRALEIICRTSAVRDLSLYGYRSRISSGWLDLAASFATDADRLIEAFRPPFDEPTAPTIG